jgi:hypothetical protein
VPVLVMASREKQLLEQKFIQRKTSQMAYLTRTPLLAFHAYDFSNQSPHFWEQGSTHGMRNGKTTAGLVCIQSLD